MAEEGGRRGTSLTCERVCSSSVFGVFMASARQVRSSFRLLFPSDYSSTDLPSLWASGTVWAPRLFLVPGGKHMINQRPGAMWPRKPWKRVEQLLGQVVPLYLWQLPFFIVYTSTIWVVASRKWSPKDLFRRNWLVLDYFEKRLHKIKRLFFFMD